MGKKRIGNTTDSRRETRHLQAYNEKYACEVEEYKKFAAARKAQRKYGQDKILEKYRAARDYFDECDIRKKPYTIAGVVLAMQIGRRTWDRWANGDHDYLYDEYIAEHDIREEDIEVIDDVPCHRGVALICWSDLTEYVYLTIQNQLETNLYTNRGNPAGSIFSLKHNYKWREDDAPNTVNQTLVIADAEQARKALSMLKEEE